MSCSSFQTKDRSSCVKGHTTSAYFKNWPRSLASRRRNLKKMMGSGFMRCRGEWCSRNYLLGNCAIWDMTERRPSFTKSCKGRAKAEPKHFKPEQLVHGNERSVLFVRFATSSCLYPLRTLVENKLLGTCESQIRVKNPALFNYRGSTFRTISKRIGYVFIFSGVKRKCQLSPR